MPWTIFQKKNIVGADMTILDFVRDAADHECRLVVSGTKISGLVGLSDLQRLPVRAALFGLITYFEILLSRGICEHMEESEWLSRLGDRRPKVEKAIRKARRENAHVSSILSTFLSDKTKLAAFIPAIGEDADFQRRAEHIVRLRNDLAHANEYAAIPEKALETCRTVNDIIRWCEKLRA